MVTFERFGQTGPPYFSAPITNIGKLVREHISRVEELQFGKLLRMKHTTFLLLLFEMRQGKCFKLTTRPLIFFYRVLCEVEFNRGLSSYDLANPEKSS